MIGIKEDPVRMVVYAFGFACSNYVGCAIEDKLAIGLLTINVIVTEEDGEILVEKLRDDNIAVTVVDAQGLHKHKKLLIIHAKRRRKREIVKFIENIGIQSVITINDIKTVYGGYGLKK